MMLPRLNFETHPKKEGRSKYIDYIRMKSYFWFLILKCKNLDSQGKNTHNLRSAKRHKKTNRVGGFKPFERYVLQILRSFPQNSGI